MVWATDPETEENALKEVTRVFRGKTDEWVHVFAGEEEIVCTPGHPFWIPVKGWTKAIDLRTGEILQLLNGEYDTITFVRNASAETTNTSAWE